MKIALILIMLVSSVPEPLTFNQVNKLWLVDGYNFQDYAIWASTYGSRPSVAWGLLDHEVWIPFPAQTFFDGNSSGRIKVVTKFDVNNSLCLVVSRRIKSDLTTVFTPQSIPHSYPASQSYPVSHRYVVPLADPNIVIEPFPLIDPNSIIEPIVAIDTNVLILQIETIMDADPNNPDNPVLKGLLDLLKENKP